MLEAARHTQVIVPIVIVKIFGDALLEGSVHLGGEIPKLKDCAEVWITRVVVEHVFLFIITVVH